MTSSETAFDTTNQMTNQPTDYSDVDIDRYKGVLIDLDDTLYRYEPCHQKALAECFATNNMGMSEGEYKQKYRSARDVVTSRLYPQGVCRSRLFAFQLMCEEAKIPQPFSTALELDDIYWSTFARAMKIDHRANTFLSRCTDKGIPICVVTDMTAHVQIRKLHALGINKMIAAIVTSEEIGAEKPDPRMFLSGLKKLGISANDTIMLGDSFSKDVQGALAAGIQARLIKL